MLAGLGGEREGLGYTCYRLANIPPRGLTLAPNFLFSQTMVSMAEFVDVGAGCSPQASLAVRELVPHLAGSIEDERGGDPENSLK